MIFIKLKELMHTNYPAMLRLHHWREDRTKITPTDKNMCFKFRLLNHISTFNLARILDEKSYNESIFTSVGGFIKSAQEEKTSERCRRKMFFPPRPRCLSKSGFNSKDVIWSICVDDDVDDDDDDDDETNLLPELMGCNHWWLVT